MTIEQLIIKLRAASNEDWNYVELDQPFGDSIVYEIRIDYRHQSLVLKTELDPIKPDSFEAKECVDRIVNKVRQE